MGLINYEQLEDGFDASANLWNERFGILFNEINGNLDSANLKNASITTAKIAPGAVTSDKLDVNVYIDDNGWTVTDYGTSKEYRLRYAGTTTLNAYSGVTLAEQLLPQGITNINQVSMSWSVRNAAWEFQYIVAPGEVIANKIRPLVYNASALNSKSDNFVYDFVLKDNN